MDGGREDDDAFLLQFLLVVDDLHELLVLLVVLAVLVDEVTVGLVEVERIYGALRRHLLML